MTYAIVVFGIIVLGYAIYIYSAHKDKEKELNAIFENDTVKLIDSIALIVSGIIAFGLYPRKYWLSIC